MSLGTPQHPKSSKYFVNVVVGRRRVGEGGRRDMEEKGKKREKGGGREGSPGRKRCEGKGREEKERGRNQRWEEERNTFINTFI